MSLSHDADAWDSILGDGALPLTLDVPMVFDGTGSIISEYTVALTGGQPVTFRTTNLSAGSNPVLHLLDDSSGLEVELDDDSGPGVAAQRTYTPPSTAIYRIVARARTNSTAGVDSGDTIRRRPLLPLSGAPAEFCTTSPTDHSEHDANTA